MSGVPFDDIPRRGCTNLTGKDDKGTLLYCAAASIPGPRTPRCRTCADATFGEGWENRSKKAAEKAVKNVGPLKARAKRTVMSRNWG